MFGRSTNDVSETLMRMQDEARVTCRHHQGNMAKQMAEWMAQDRRFDAIDDKQALALKAMDCRSHGRVLDLGPSEKTSANSYFGHTNRSV